MEIFTGIFEQQLAQRAIARRIQKLRRDVARGSDSFTASEVNRLARKHHVTRETVQRIIRETTMENRRGES